MLDFLIFYEHKAREYNNDCLLKAELERRGYTVEIAKTAELSYWSYLFRRRPKVVVTYSLYNDASLVTQVISVAGSVKKIVNLQWEQASTNNKAIEIFHTPKETAALATHICWGQESYKRLIRAGVNNAVITGAIQMDFFKKGFNDYFLSKQVLEKENNLSQGKMILYISSFALTSLQEKEAKVLGKKIGEDCFERIQLTESSRQATLDWIDCYLKEDHSSNFIYRPHPGENIDEILLNIKTKHQNFHIISNRNVKQWIHAADIIITWISTAVAEVYYANKSCLILRPVPVPEKYDIGLFKNARFITSYEQFIKAMSSNNQSFPISEYDVLFCYSGSLNSYAFMNVSNLLERVHNTNKYDIPRFPFKLYSNAIKVNFKRLIKLCIYKLNITGQTWPFSQIRRVREWLNFFLYYMKKEEAERVTPEEKKEIMLLLKGLIGKGLYEE